MTLSADDRRDLERIRSVALRFPDAEEDELQGRPLFRVGVRRFAIVNGDGSPDRPRWRRSGRSLHVATDPDERAALGQDPRFVPSPHHGQRGWVALRLDGDDVDWDEVAELIEAAYRHVAPRRLVERLDGSSATIDGPAEDGAGGAARRPGAAPA